MVLVYLVYFLTIIGCILIRIRVKSVSMHILLIFDLRDICRCTVVNMLICDVNKLLLSSVISAVLSRFIARCSLVEL